MDLIANFNWIEAIGWLASLTTVAAYSVSTMLPLRLFAILSSLCFLIYAAIMQVWPLLAMELILLPINTYRFWEVLSLRGKLGKASADRGSDFSLIKAYGKRSQIEAGSIVFERGDAVDQLYYLDTGRIRIEDMGIELAAGDVFGEIAFFTDAATRTATARCIEDAEVYGITETQLMRLQFEDPSFGLSLMRTITRRLMENKQSAQSLSSTRDPISVSAG